MKKTKTCLSNFNYLPTLKKKEILDGHNTHLKYTKIRNALLLEYIRFLA